MDMIFGNPLRETFSNKIGLPGGRNISTSANNGVGSQLNYIPPVRKNTLNGNMIYSGKGFLGIAEPYTKGDDQPLYFGFSM